MDQCSLTSQAAAGPAESGPRRYHQFPLIASRMTVITDSSAADAAVLPSRMYYGTPLISKSVEVQNAGTPQMATSTESGFINRFMKIRWARSASIRLLEIELLLSNTYLRTRARLCSPPWRGQLNFRLLPCLFRFDSSSRSCSRSSGRR